MVQEAAKKHLRNHNLLIEISSGITKQEICEKYRLSLRQLNRILTEMEKETEEWYNSLPRKTMIQIFRNNSQKIYNEIKTMEEIRNSVDDPIKKFEMTKSVINAYAHYNKLVSEGPSLVRQKEITEQAEKIIATK